MNEIHGLDFLHLRFVRYCMSRIEMLIHHGVTPIVVFDGGRLPMKADEEDSRRR